jgi:hypothetical protein
MAKPLEIEVQASNGASDYGNKFGEPVVVGFTRSFGLQLPSGERREWIKPIMFSGGIGFLDASYTTKQASAPRMRSLWPLAGHTLPPDATPSLILSVTRWPGPSSWDVGGQDWRPCVSVSSRLSQAPSRFVGRGLMGLSLRVMGCVMGGVMGV